MWLDQQSRRDKNGRRWNFCIWYDSVSAEKATLGQRLFFWDDSKTQSGVMFFLPGSDVHFSRFKQFIGKLASSSALRKRYQRELRFPLERHYSEYGTFPEEK